MELSELQDFFNSDSKILTIRGLAGVGKTTLVSKFFEERSVNIFWYRFSDFSSLRGLMTRLAEFLSQLGRHRLKEFVEKGLDMEEAIMILEEDLKDEDFVLVLDDVQRSDALTINLFKVLKDLDILGKMIFLGRSIPAFYDRSDVIVRNIVRELTLLGLDKNGSMELLEARNITGDLARLVEVTKGHPLMLELVTEDTKGQADEYFKEEVFQKLDSLERGVLELASVFRYPFPAQGIIDQADYDTLDSLVHHSLIQRTGDVYDLHDLIREFFYNRLNEKERTAHHRTIAEFYRQRGEEGLIEAMHHYLCSEDVEEAVQIANEKGIPLLRKGYVSEYGQILNELLEKDPPNKSMLLIQKGIIFDLNGELDPALQTYQEALKSAKDSKDMPLVSECHLKIGGVYNNYGRIYHQMKDWDQAIENFQKALEIGMESGNLYSQAQFLLDFGKMYRDKGDKKKARKQFEKSKEAFVTLGNTAKTEKVEKELETL